MTSKIILIIIGMKIIIVTIQCGFLNNIQAKINVGDTIKIGIGYSSNIETVDYILKYTTIRS